MEIWIQEQGWILWISSGTRINTMNYIFSHNFKMQHAMAMKLGHHVELCQGYYPMCQSSCHDNPDDIT